MLRVGGGKEHSKGSYGLLGVFGVFAVGVFFNWQLSLRSRRRFNYAGMKWPSAHYVGGRHRSTCSRIHALRSVGRGGAAAAACSTVQIFLSVLKLFWSTGCLCVPHMRLPRCAHCADLQSRTR